MMMNISVIIPVYNAEAFLQKAVESALQFEEVKEVLLIEDASPDNSLEVCKELIVQFDRVKLFQHPDKCNHGAGASRNLGLVKAAGDFIAFLDADDYYLPNRFEAEKELFKDKNIDGVFGAIGTEFLSEKGKLEFQKKFKNQTLTTVKHAAEGKDVFYGLLGLNSNFGAFFSLIALTVRTESIRKNYLRFNEDLRVHQDSDFIIKLSYLGHLKSGNITKPVSIRGVHDDNRITKIKPYSSKFYLNNLLLQNSLYQWSKSAKLIDVYSTKIKLNYLSFKIANQKGLKKWISFFITVLIHPEFLKTRYRFHALNKHADD